MEKKDYRLKGHESFILRDGWLTKGLRAVHADAKVFSNNNGADALGVGTNMAKAIRYWLRVAGLTNDTPKGVTLADLGEIIYQEDPYFEDVFSLWIAHINIVRNFQLATSWNVFFNNIDVTTFNRKEMAEMMMESIINIINDTPPERSVKDDCSAILQMYSDNEDASAYRDPEEKKKSPFSALGLLNAVEKDTFEKGHPAINEIDPLVILYMIADVLNTEKMLQIDDIVSSDNMVGKVLNLNRVAINDFLDMLQNQEYIIVNRTAGLDVVYPDKTLSPIETVKAHYEGRSRL